MTYIHRRLSFRAPLAALILLAALLLGGCGDSDSSASPASLAPSDSAYTGSGSSAPSESIVPGYEYLAGDWYLFGLAHGPYFTLNADGSYTRYSAEGEEVYEEGTFTVWDDGNGTQVIGFNPHESNPKEGPVAEDENSFTIYEYGSELNFVHESAISGGASTLPSVSSVYDQYMDLPWEAEGLLLNSVGYDEQTDAYYVVVQALDSSKSGYSLLSEETYTFQLEEGVFSARMWEPGADGAQWQLEYIGPEDFYTGYYELALRRGNNGFQPVPCGYYFEGGRLAALYEDGGDAE